MLRASNFERREETMTTTDPRARLAELCTEHQANADARARVTNGSDWSELPALIEQSKAIGDEIKEACEALDSDPRERALKAYKTAVRLKHSLAADDEIARTLPEIEAQIDAALAAGKPVMVNVD